jgi:hypothetical protein
VNALKSLKMNKGVISSVLQLQLATEDKSNLTTGLG